MKRRFKSRRKIKIPKFIKIIIFLIILYLIYKLFNVKVNFKVDENIIKMILNDNSYSDYNVFNSAFKLAAHDTINNPVSLLATNTYYYEKKEDIKIVSNEKDIKPIIYLYNTHQKEEYSNNYIEDNSLLPTVYTASYMMKEKFDKMGLYTIVEDNDISEYLNKHNMKYSESYEASRYYLVNTIEEYDSIKLYIDVHRDAITHEYSTINIDGVDCAKIMFVVGKEHDNYSKNLENTKRLNDMIKDKYPTLTRGVLEKEGAGVNGIYNQDLGSNIMLIEVGGNYNNISEVANTIDLIIPIIGEYINEKG